MHVALTGPRKKNEGPKSHVWRNLILSNQKSVYMQLALPAYGLAALPARGFTRFHTVLVSYLQVSNLTYSQLSLNGHLFKTDTSLS